MVDDWLERTPNDVIAKNFGVNIFMFTNLLPIDPYVFHGPFSTLNVTSVLSVNLSGNSSLAYRTLQHPSENVPGAGGVVYKVDSTLFPASETVTATFVRLSPGGLRELHWHPNLRQTLTASCFW